MYLNQLLEDYRESGDKEILDDFLERLWASNYTFRKYKKYHSYRVDKGLLRNDPKLIELFEKHSKIEYTVCKSFHKKQLDHIDYIRIHINNMFGYLFDKDVYYKSIYYKILLTPKNEYFSAIDQIKKGNQVDYDCIESKILKSMDEAEKLKLEYISKKSTMEWTEYKKLISEYIERIFQNYIPSHEYEKKHGWEVRVNTDSWSEDNYIVKYFCKSLTGYMRNYVRDQKPKKDIEKNCVGCSKRIVANSNRQKYCNSCWKTIRNEQVRKNMNKMRKNKDVII